MYVIFLKVISKHKDFEQTVTEKANKGEIKNSQTV